MYPIVKKEQLADKIFLMDVKAERVAKTCMPGQFIIVKIDEEGERIPLTICDYDREAGTITIVFQVVGASTQRMTGLEVGDSFRDFVGPLGCASEFCSEEIEDLKKKKILFVAGGVGAAPVYPQVKWMHENGIDVDVIVGSKTKDMLILEKEMEAVAGNLYVTTDDGSYGRSGMVTTVIEDLVKELHKLDSKIKNNIQIINLTPTKATTDLLTIELYDGNSIRVPLSQLTTKLPYYEKIKSKLSNGCIVDMEVGLYTTTPEVEASKTDKDKKKDKSKTDKKEDKEISDEGQETTTLTKQNTEEEANAENSDIQGVGKPTVNQDKTLQPSPSQD